MKDKRTPVIICRMAIKNINDPKFHKYDNLEGDGTLKKEDCEIAISLE